MSDVFEKYIPSFEYELVSLKDYSFEDLARFGDVLSLFMMVDKLRTAEAFEEMGRLREKYGEKMNSLNVPPHLKELLVRLISLLLMKINVPKDEIEKFVEGWTKGESAKCWLLKTTTCRKPEGLRGRKPGRKSVF